MEKLFQQSNGFLQDLLIKIQYLNHLSQLLYQQIEPELAKHCKVANFRNQVLVIAVDSSAWVTQLRYRIPELVNALRRNRELAELKKIEYFIQPVGSPKTESLSSLKISPESLEVISETATSLPEGNLKQSLQKLSNRD